MIHLVTNRLGMRPDFALPIIVFFAYAFLGYVMECVVLTIEKRRVVVNRGFVRHLPFCIIYGFGALMGYALLVPFRNNFFLLFVVGAVGATVFEYAVAMLQIHIFGDFWWDYTNKPLNYKGILCLESTVGWGVLAIVIVRYIHDAVVGLASLLPSHVTLVLAAALLMAYALDFALSARLAAQEKRDRQNNVQTQGAVHTRQDEYKA